MKPFWLANRNLPTWTTFTIQNVVKTRGAGGHVVEAVTEYEGKGNLIPLRRSLEGARRGGVVHATHELQIAAYDNDGETLPDLNEAVVVIEGENYRPMSLIDRSGEVGLIVMRLVKEVLARAH